MQGSHRRIGGPLEISWSGGGLAAMQADQLVAALGACQSPDPAVRKAAEEALNQVALGAAAGGGHHVMRCRRRRCLPPAFCGACQTCSQMPCRPV